MASFYICYLSIKLAWVSIGFALCENICPYGWNQNSNGLCSVNCKENSRSPTNINCQLPPFSKNEIYNSTNNIFTMKPGKTLNVTSTNCVLETFCGRNISLKNPFLSKSQYSVNKSSHLNRFPVSPQLQQCDIQSTHPDRYKLINGTVLVISEKNFTAYLGDFFIDGNNIAYTCSQAIKSKFFSYNEPRCHYVSLYSHEYVLTDSGSMIISKANVTIKNPSYSFEMDGITKACLPTSISYLNCPERIVYQQYYYNIGTDLVAKTTSQSYNLDNYYINNENFLIVCLDETDAYVPPIVNTIYLIELGFNVVSTLCLISTIFLQIEFYNSNYHTKCLLLHIICLICKYLGIILKRFINYRSTTSCYAMYVFMYYFSMATFFWLNVIAYDSWIKFSNLKTAPIYCRYSFFDCATLKNGLRFLIYNVYVWGMSLLFVVITLIIDLIPMPKDIMVLNPQIGAFCWFNNLKSMTVYYYAPLGILMCINLIFFISTIHIINYAGHGTDIVNRKRRQQTFKVAIKLFVLMGLVGIVEVICFALQKFQTNTFQTFYISNGLTGIQGVVIFAIYFKTNSLNCNLKCVHCASLQNSIVTKYADSVHSLKNTRRK